MKHFRLFYSLLICFILNAPDLGAQNIDTTAQITTQTTTQAAEVPVADDGLDAKINEAFTPVANFIGSVILYEIKINEVGIPIIVIILSLGGLFFTFYFGFPNFRNFGTAIQIVRGKYEKVEQNGTKELHPEASVFTVDGDIVNTIRDEHHHGEVSHFQALSTAVSGTVGLGNIAGVTIAIALGGPGATFWMIVSGLLGMTLKFVECTLGVHYRDINKDGVVFGGPMYYLSKGLKEKGYTGLGKALAVIFAVLCIGGSFGGGNAAQSNQAAEQLKGLFGMTGGSAGFMIGVGLAVIVGITIIGGIKRIASVTEKLVPLMAVIYIVACMVVIGSHFSFIDDAFRLIITEAFNPQAGIGGLIGVLVVGFRRAAFSNEAGAGSASIAHSAVRTKYSASEGLVALLEPFIDTVVICTMTALVIITFNENGAFTYGNAAVMINGNTYQGATLTSLAFQDSISWFPTVLTVAIFLFAVSTMISWSYYGQQAWMYLFGKSKTMEMTYKVLFLLFIIIGASANMQSVWDFSDAMILGMVFPNMVGLLFLYPTVKTELDKYLKAIRAKK
ncbi:MAG: alanine:cation symporter family protein [Saprospiraceae bacterium]|nr:alanine:cation symporter family protein [Saprospiraceae bacterium]